MISLRSLVLLVATASALTGCGRFGGGGQDIEVESRSAEDLYVTAEFDLDAGNSVRAARLFDEVERLYPYSEWAKRATMMAAFSYYDAGLFNQSRDAATRFLDLYPADDDAAYAQYLIALSYYDQIVDVKRDQALTFEALQELRETIERYPDSDYAASASLKFDLAFDHLAGKEMEVGRYYLKKGHYTAAINRFRVVVEDFQTTMHTPEALHRLVEAYLSLGLTEDAQTAGAILGHNYQGSVWYEDSYKLLTDRGLEAKDSGQGWLSRIYRQVIRGKWL